MICSDQRRMEERHIPSFQKENSSRTRSLGRLWKEVGRIPLAGNSLILPKSYNIWMKMVWHSYFRVLTVTVMFLSDIVLNIWGKCGHWPIGTKPESYGRCSVHWNKELDVPSQSSLWINGDCAHETLGLNEVSICREYTWPKRQEFTRLLPMSIGMSLMDS